MLSQAVNFIIEATLNNSKKIPVSLISTGKPWMMSARALATSGEAVEKCSHASLQATSQEAASRDLLISLKVVGASYLRAGV